MDLPPLLLILATSTLWLSADGALSDGPTRQDPPGVEVLGWDIGPGTRMRLDELEYAGQSGRIVGIPLASGLQPGISDLALEASNWRDPSSNYDLYVNVLRPEKVTMASLIVRNSGAKTVKAIEWDFPHPHISDNKPVLRYALRSKTSIKPGEIKTIRELLRNSAKGFNTAKGNGPERTVTFISRESGISLTVPIDCLRDGARINRIRFSDGSSWQRP